MTLGTWMKAAALVAAGTLAVARAEDEEKISLEKLPAPVRAAIKAKFPGAELKGASKESEEGETVFEVRLTYKGDRYEVALEPNGEIEEVERAIFVDALPSAVVKAVKARYSKARIEKAEEVTDEDGEVCYEVVVDHGDKTIEVAFSPRGKIKKGAAEGDEDKEEAEKREKAEKKKKAEKREAEGEKHEKKGQKERDRD